MAGLFDDLPERSQRLSDDMSAYAAGDINTGEMALRTAGETMGGVMDMTAPVVDPIIGAVASAADHLPDMVKKGMEDMMNGVLDTGPVKYAMKYMEEHPRAARNIAMAANVAELLPVGRMAAGGVGKAMNAGIQETVTDMPGFYAGPVQAVKAFSTAAAAGAPTALKTAVSPQMRAQRRAMGTGQTRMDEFINHPKDSTVKGNALASSMMGKQIDDRVADKTIMDYMPSVRSEMAHVGKRGAPGAMDAFKANAPDMPEHIAEKFMDRNTAALDKSYGLLGSALPKVTNMGKQGEKIHVVRNLDAPGSNLRPETVASGQVGGRAHQYLRNTDMLARHEARLGRPVDTPEAVTEFLTVASAMERGRFDSLRKALPEASKKKGRGVLFDEYFDSKYGTKKMTPKRQATMDAMDKWLKENKPNIAVDPDDPSIVWYTTSYMSRAQELGGVGQRMAIDTKNQTLYNSVLDGHDMFGMDPSGGVGLDTLVPPVQQGFGKTHVQLKTSDAAKAQQWEYMEQLGAKTGIPPHRVLHKSGPNKGKVKSHEKAGAYEKRVAETYKAEATAGDYLGAGANAASMGLLAAPNSGVEGEGQGY